MSHCDNLPKANHKKQYLSLCMATSTVCFVYQSLLKQSQLVTGHPLSFLLVNGVIFTFTKIGQSWFGKLKLEALHVQRGQ